LLQKIARFIHLRETSGILHEEPLEAEVPIIPAGDEETLSADEIEWLPLAARSAPSPAPLELSRREIQDLARLPQRNDFIAEMIAPLVPGLSFMDEAVGRPCLARVPFIVDRRSRIVFCARIAHGAKQLYEAVGPAFVEALQTAKARPKTLRVDNEQLAAALRPACESIGVRLVNSPLDVAPDAWAEFEDHFQTLSPR